MSRPRFLADHDFRGPIISGVLRTEPACEIIRAIDLRLETLPDEKLVERAAQEGLIILTHDRNTLVGAAYSRVEQGLPMKGVFVGRIERPFWSRIIADIVMTWACSEPEEWEDRVEFLPW